MMQYRWKVLWFSLIMQTLVVGVGIYSFAFLVVPWVAEFNTTRSEIMIGFTLMTISTGLLSPIGGILIDRFQSRQVITAAITGFTLGLVIIAMAQNAMIIVLAFSFLIPLGVTLAGALMAQTLVAQAFAEKRGAALGICSLGTSFGGLLAPVAITTLLAQFDWRLVVMLLAVVVPVIVLPLTWAILEPEQKHADHQENNPSTSTLKLLRERNIYFLGLALMLPLCVFVGLLQNLGLFALDLAVSLQQAGLVVSITSVLMAVGKFSTGTLADRIESRYLYTGLILLTATGGILTATAGGFIQLALGMCLVGFSAGGIVPLVSIVAARQFGPSNFGRVMGVVIGFGSLSGIAPLIAGMIRDLQGNYQMAFLTLLPLLLPAVICFSRLKAR